ncbi:hypothetical protein ZEAMMB73_Zm00001d003374 [Zea mays]|uniref:Uncharacterized protein n=1 Tax=Zea mays TaxID=4577 RepID=A0A1D6E8W0_MAIZE|nr:hypothetical protein ZEAMMB73_Zm00001d003374 [Zea mays]
MWDDANLKQLIEIFKEGIEARNRPHGCWTRKRLEEPWAKAFFFTKSGMKLVKTRLKNKLDDLDGMMQSKLLCARRNGGMKHLARCNNPERGLECGHVKFQKRGPKYLDDLHRLFDKVHVSEGFRIMSGTHQTYREPLLRTDVKVYILRNGGGNRWGSAPPPKI